MHQLTGPQYLLCIALWFLMLMIYKSAMTRQTRKGSYFLFFAIVSLFSTFGFITGDYFHYEGLYEELSISSFNHHLEEFYWWLLKGLPNSYNLWRFAIWAPATLIMVLTFKRLKLDPKLSCLLFTLILMTYFCTLRNSLGYVALYYGASFLLFPNQRKVQSYIIGVAIVVCSYFLHKSMFVYISVFVFAMLVPFNKWTYIASILLFPVLYKSASLIAMWFLGNTIADETSTASGEQYLESDFYQIANLGGLLQMSLHRLPILIMLFIAIYKIYFKKQSLNYGWKVYLNYTFMLMYVSFLFYGQQVSAFLSPRFWDASTYTATIFLAYYLSQIKRTRLIRACLYVLILGNLYDFAYIAYKKIL